MENSDERKARELQQVQAVRMGNMREEDLTFTGVLGIGDIETEHQKRKKEKSTELTIQLHNFNEFIARLDRQIAEARERIAELEARRLLAVKAAELAFEQMHEAEELLEAIENGISDEERLRLVKLLGPKAQNAEPEELMILLEAQIGAYQRHGLVKTEEVEEIDQQILAERERLAKLEAERKAYEAATSPEERNAIEERMEDSLTAAAPLSLKNTEQEIAENFENQLAKSVSFAIAPLPIN